MGDVSVRLALLAAGIALAAAPALAQSAMTPGGGATPQPRVAPAPQASIAAPQAPVAAPQVPLVAPAPSGDRVIQTTNSIRATGTPTGPAEPKPNYQNQPIPGIDVVVQKKPNGGGEMPVSKTDASGQVTFKELPPGNYDIVLPKPARSSGYDPVIGGVIQLTTFVNGKLASRTEFPVGSSVGTFAVSSAKDTVVLKFETNLGSTPVNGVGGTGGGR